jgi:hypothetical protein
MPSWMVDTVVIDAAEVGSSAKDPAWKMRAGRFNDAVNADVQFWLSDRRIQPIGT